MQATSRIIKIVVTRDDALESRREFIRNVLLGGAAVATGGAVSGCGNSEVDIAMTL